MQDTDPRERPLHTSVSERRRQVYNLLAWLCFGLGFIGVAVPLMPTTVFWICAAWLWLRSHPSRVRFLVEHPTAGASIRRFLERGEICRSGKIAAITGMSGSYLIWYILAWPGWVAATTVAAILALAGLWILTRPNSERDQPNQLTVTLDPASRLCAQPGTKSPGNPPN